MLRKKKVIKLNHIKSKSYGIKHAILYTAFIVVYIMLLGLIDLMGF